MPSLLKDRLPTGRLGGLIAAILPARAGPLPVQTGFPTSLADLVVKNHGRLKKPFSKGKKRGISNMPAPSPPPSPTTSPPPPPVPPPPDADSPSTEPRPDLSPVEPVCHASDRDFGLGLGFVALVGEVSLALLVIWSRKVVAAVTIAAFSFILLESIRSCSIPRTPRAPAAKLDLGGRGHVSPIQEVEAELEAPRPSSSDSDRGSDVSVLSIEESSAIGDDWSKSKKEKKRSWKKLIANKLQKARKCKDAGSSGSFRNKTSQSNAMIGGNAEATDPSDSRRGERSQEAGADAKSSDSWGTHHGDGGMGNDDDLGVVEIDGWLDLTKTGNVRGSQLPAVVVSGVVLAGLVAGTLPAVVFTVLCSAFVSSLQRSPWHGVNLKKGGD